MFDTGIKVLVVDDMATMRKIVIKSLRELGFEEFMEVADGGLAWDRLKESPENVGLIICDWNMPNVTGIEFLKKIRASQDFNQLPFILLTAESEVSQVKEALEAGVDNYIVKPFTVEILKRKLQDTYKKINP